MRRGLSLVEILVVLAIVALVAAVGIALVRPSHAGRAAAAAATLLAWARLQAVWSGHDVAIVPTTGGLVARTAPAADPCTGGSVARRVLWRSYPLVRVLRPLRDGVLWRAAGGALSCAGGGVISDRLVLGDPRMAVAVVVSSLGRVRVEVVP